METFLTNLTHANIEQTLLPFRTGRRLILAEVRSALLRGELAVSPFLFLSRAFCRIKSADSILEKIERKRLVIPSASEIPNRMLDILGFRFLSQTVEELFAIDRFLRKKFEVVIRTDRMSHPGECGEREIEYALKHHADGKEYSFEVQLRTFLQHYWAATTFHLYHKQPSEVRERNRADLVRFSEAVEAAETAALPVMQVETNAVGSNASETLDPLERRVHIVVVARPDERFIEHKILTLTGNDVEDHYAIVAAKLAAYDHFPGCALVECSCLDFQTVILNEPLIRISVDALAQLNL